MKTQAPWSERLRLSELAHGPLSRRLDADEAARGRIARALDLDALDHLSADLKAERWLDGVRLSGAWRARVRQTCGVTLEPLENELRGEFEVRAVPEGSAAAPGEAGEATLDVQAEDPPDVLAEDSIDVAAYVVEHLALEVDPYPRKPGAEFEPPAGEAELSPFAVLKTLRPRDDG